ncbi:MAG: hypothetical protein AAF665_08250 [Pseudomonadota bacterium]
MKMLNSGFSPLAQQRNMGAPQKLESSITFILLTKTAMAICGERRKVETQGLHSIVDDRFGLSRRPFWMRLAAYRGGRL